MNTIQREAAYASMTCGLVVLLLGGAILLHWDTFMEETIDERPVMIGMIVLSVLLGLVQILGLRKAKSNLRQPDSE